MKNKKFITIVCSLALVAAYAVSSFAANTTTLAIKDDTEALNKPNRPILTDQQKEEMKARHKVMRAKFDATNEKWNALTDAQKTEIYNLKEKSKDIESQIIDKYLQFGIIDKETETNIKARITEQNTKMRQEGKMPVLGGKRGGHIKFYRSEDLIKPSI